MSFSSRLALAAATVTAAAGAIAAGPPETGYDRPGGVYTNISTKDAAACAIACAQDRICMSWTFRVTEFVGCSLKAVVPAAVADRDAISGIDDRAGDFLSLVSNAPPPAPASVQPAPSPPAALAATETQPAPVKDTAPELLGAPTGLSSAIGAITTATLHPAALMRGPAPDIRPILEISAPAPLLGAAPVTPPALYTSAFPRAPVVANTTLILPPEPEPLVAPNTLTARFATITRASYRAPAMLARPAQVSARLVVEEPPAEPLVTPIMPTPRLATQTRAAYRAPTTPARAAPAFVLAVVEEPPPAPLHAPGALTPARTVFSLVAYRTPTILAGPAPALKPIVVEESPALNDHVVVALSSPEQPNSSVVPVAYVAPSSTPPSGSGASDDELLGAP